MKAWACGIAVILAALFVATPARAAELSGYALTEARLFAHPPQFPGQERHGASVAFQPEFYHEWQGGQAGQRSVAFTPFLRLDGADGERTHFDVRELFGLWVFDGWEAALGVRKVFWGVTESQHLVDIVNQTDLVESIDGEEKLGQPMLSLSARSRWGTVGVFILPYFRERTFPGRSGRLRGERVVDTGSAEFESGADEWHTDFALRYSRVFGDWDVGLSHFIGTGREPTLTEAAGGALIPRYEQINQSGLDLQLTTGQWLWKFETIYRSGQGEPFYALTGGFEYTFVGVAGSSVDVGVLSEWLYDERGKDAATPFDDDLMAGMRITMNDIPGTEALFGIIQDLSGPSRLIFLEASRRLTDHWKVTVEARVFSGPSDDDALSAFRDDDMLQMELAYYF